VQDHHRPIASISWDKLVFFIGLEKVWELSQSFRLSGMPTQLAFRTTTLYVYGRPRGGLRLQCLDACLQGQVQRTHQLGATTYHDIAESNLGWNTAADANHKADLNKRKCAHHLGRNGRCRITADLAFRQTGYDDVVLAGGSQCVRVMIVRRFGKIGMSPIQHCRRGLLLWQCAHHPKV
jgi:hypothetical protein